MARVRAEEAAAKGGCRGKLAQKLFPAAEFALILQRLRHS